MKIRIAEKIGFCSGVKRSIKLALEAGNNSYTLGNLIHNALVIKELEEKGIKPIKNLNEIIGGKLIISAHGTSKKLNREAKQKGLKVIDATCPKVKRVHLCIEKLLTEGFKTIIFGNPEHSEVKALVDSYDDISVVDDIDEAKRFRYYEKLGIVSQTSQSISKYNEICEELTKHCKKFKKYNTICEEVLERQKIAERMLKEVDLMIVIGDKESANTTKLFEICREVVSVELIESLEKMKERKDYILKSSIIGVVSGTSAPDSLVRDLLTEIK